MATSGDQLKAAHDECAEAVAKNSRSLRAYLVFHPHLLEASKAQMSRALEPNSPFVGFKLHGGIHQYPADGPNYRPVFEFANEHRLHVLYHEWGGVEHFQATHVTLQSPENVPVHVDGENVGALPASCSVQRQALRVLVP